VLRRSVELLAELHDVHAVLTERRAHRRARGRHPGGHLELDVGFYLPCHRGNPRRSNLLNMSEIELDRRRAAEALHGDPHLVLLVVDLLDDAADVVERPGHPSPGSKSTFGRGLSAPSWTRLRMAIASRSLIGVGRSLLPPMKPRTFGTSFTRCQVSSSISICTST